MALSPSQRAHRLLDQRPDLEKVACIGLAELDADQVLFLGEAPNMADPPLQTWTTDSGLPRRLHHDRDRRHPRAQHAPRRGQASGGGAIDQHGNAFHRDIGGLRVETPLLWADDLDRPPAEKTRS